MDANTRSSANEDALLGRAELAEELTKRGYPIAGSTLATMAVRGGGPPFSKWGVHVRYELSAALAWAKNRMTPARNTTIEHARLST
jgi:hypothetical protein